MTGIDLHIHTDQRIPFDRMILIAGDGRNVGKTTLACQLIREWSAREPVTAIKTSPHFHALQSDDEILERGAGYVIVRENKLSQKDSSLFLQAGASTVYFIMASQEKLGEAFLRLLPELEGKMVIAESGGLNEYVRPGRFLFVCRKGRDIVKKHYLKFEPEVVISDW